MATLHNTRPQYLLGPRCPTKAFLKATPWKMTNPWCDLQQVRWGHIDISGVNYSSCKRSQTCFVLFIYTLRESVLKTTVTYLRSMLRGAGTAEREEQNGDGRRWWDFHSWWKKCPQQGGKLQWSKDDHNIQQLRGGQEASSGRAASTFAGDRVIASCWRTLSPITHQYSSTHLLNFYLQGSPFVFSTLSLGSRLSYIVQLLCMFFGLCRCP